LLCDATYLGACVGTPTITATHDFPGQISPNNCQPAPQCEDVINIGGTFSFPAGSEGRWTTTINIIANYQ
jgi:hypothetical protein